MKSRAFLFARLPSVWQTGYYCLISLAHEADGNMLDFYAKPGINKTLKTERFLAAALSGCRHFTHILQQELRNAAQWKINLIKLL